MPTQERLKDLFDYETETGRLLNTGRAYYNKTRVGLNAGFPDKLGYRRIGIDGTYHGYHRCVWVYHNGVIPERGEIDHVDHDPTNNRIENLRLTNKDGNLHNKRLSKNNTAGRVGIYAERGRWRAMIGDKGKLIHLGTFVSKRDAIAAREAAEMQYGYHPNHGSVV